jgi:hypothetical protein
MVYIPPEQFTNAPTSSLSECPHCGYNLQGLAGTVACPECGKHTSVQRRKYTPDIPLSQMSEPFVKRLAFCCITTVIVFPAFAAREYVPFFQISSAHTTFVVDLSIAFVWIIGVLLLTTPLRNPEAKRYGLGANGILRRITRWGSIAAGGIVLSEYIAFKPLFIISGLVFSVGLISLFLLLANVADWVRDEKAKKWLEYAAWGAPFFYIISTLITLTSIPSTIAFGVGVVAYILLLFGILGMLMLTSSVLQAVTHARQYKEYQERRLKSEESRQFPTPKLRV